MPARCRCAQTRTLAKVSLRPSTVSFRHSSSGIGTRRGVATGPSGNWAGPIFMGVYDRDYYRNDPPAGGVLGGVAPICKWLIAINVAGFVLQFLTHWRATQWLALLPLAYVQ